MAESGKKRDGKKSLSKSGVSVSLSSRGASGVGLAGFIERRSRTLVILLGLLVVACVVLIGVAVGLDLRNNSETEKLEGFLDRYQKIEMAKVESASPEANAEAPAAGSATAESAATESSAAEGTATAETPAAGGKPAEAVESLDDFTLELAAFAKGASNYPAAKAWSVLGGIYASENKWAEAENAYVHSSKAGKKAPIGPVSLFNAAVCAERLGNLDTAIQRYTTLAAIPDFSQAAHAQFAIGVLYEAQNKTDEAKAAYQDVIDKFSDKDSDWSALANSRLIALSKGQPPAAEQKPPAETPAAAPEQS